MGHAHPPKTLVRFYETNVEWVEFEVAMKNTRSFFSQLWPLRIPCAAAVTLFALAWGSLSCDIERDSFLDAARNGDLERVELMLRDKPDLVFRRGLEGVTPLFLAAVGGHKAVVELLLANKAEVDAKHSTGLTPLHIAADRGHRDVAELLLANGADVNARDNYGLTPLHFAAAGGYKDVVELLLAHKADVNAGSRSFWWNHYSRSDLLWDLDGLKGATPLRVAEHMHYHDVADLLRAHGGTI